MRKSKREIDEESTVKRSSSLLTLPTVFDSRRKGCGKNGYLGWRRANLLGLRLGLKNRKGEWVLLLLLMLMSLILLLMPLHTPPPSELDTSQ